MAFKATVEGHKVEVKFTHVQGLKTMLGPRQIKAATTAYLFMDGVYRSGGIAACSVHDTFSKDVGRKLALTRALGAADLTKLIRTGIWQAYFNRGIGNGKVLADQGVGVRTAGDGEAVWADHGS